MRSENRTVCVVGAGFTGAVIAHELARSGYRVDVVEERAHVAGNCHTARDARTDIMVHVYGPHIFHTDDEEVWTYVNRFGRFGPFVNRVKAVCKGKVYSLPINLHTINQLLGTNFTPQEARAWVQQCTTQSDGAPTSFEEQALNVVGPDIYRTFLYGYTRKQWGTEPAQLPASILRRLPVRFNYNDNYYHSAYQGIPVDGYTSLVERMLDDARIHVSLNNRFDASLRDEYRHIFYSGSLDAWFGYALGRLGYRTLRFETVRGTGDLQGNAVINYCDEDVPWTRSYEHKHFAPWESHEESILYREYSAECGPGDVPFYPIRLLRERELLGRYVARANEERGVSFVGRLGTYRYIDMDAAIREALDAARQFIRQDSSGEAPSAFYTAPI
ncbi:UDP-galactopyranose mutase [Paraburkholderia kirstenboschensis]|uniref:UDP-galactopyranose mutase n=1 Tax=Paraburkholderia kirstenboschensis TaxID=1245436 RepID=A0ABZ0EC43_9BURK|nr:UDP-galactopyranose mutase [Paraburkholderia kirstenboschensis]WOD14034.1 UDP-galactopyranose mutase [Paraburkholderia kirstenboschensis]